MNQKREGKIILCLGTIISSICLLEVVQAQPEVRELKPPQLSYTANTFRDPFAESYPKKKTEKEVAAEKGENAEDVKKLPDFIVQGVIWGSSTPQAIINGSVVQLNDTIEEAKVVNIGREGVTVLFYGKEYKISVPASTASETLKNKGGKQ